MLLVAWGVIETTVAQPCEPYWSDQFHAADLGIIPFDLAVFYDGAGEGPPVSAADLYL